MADAQGNSTPEVEQGKDDAPKTFTVDEFNKAFSAREKTLMAKLAKDSEARETALLAKLQELIPKAPEPKAEETGAAKSPLDSPEYKGLLKRLAENEAKVKAAEDRAASEAAKARDTKMRQALSQALSDAGVSGVQLKHASGFLADVERRVRVDEEGTVTFKDGEDEVDLATGIKSWVKSEDAQIYLPPRGAQGSGASGGAGKKPSSGQGGEQISRQAVAEQLLSHLRGNSVVSDL